MNYEEKLKNYLQVNKCKDNKCTERTYDEMDSISIYYSLGYNKEKMKNNMSDRYEYNSVNVTTKSTEKNNESDLIIDDSLKIGLRNYKRLIEDCLDYDPSHVKTVSNYI